MHTTMLTNEDIRAVIGQSLNALNAILAKTGSQPPLPLPPVELRSTPSGLPVVVGTLVELRARWYTTYQPSGRVMMDYECRRHDERGFSAIAEVVYPSEVIEFCRLLDEFRAKAQAYTDAHVAAVEAAMELGFRSEQPAIREVADRQRAARAAAQEIALWIGEHGSRRLKLLQAEGIELGAVYQDERMTAERPGWEVDGVADGDCLAPRNAPLAALELLQECRKVEPGCRLRYYILTEEDSDSDEERIVERGYLCEATFCGWRITSRERVKLPVN